MPVYYYLSTADAEAARERVLAFTHGDTYKHVPGYQVTVSHFHTHFNEQLTDAGTMDLQADLVAGVSRARNQYRDDVRLSRR